MIGTMKSSVRILDYATEILNRNPMKEAEVRGIRTPQ